MQVIAAGGCGGDAHGRCPSSKPKSESKRWICCHLSCNKPLKTLIILNWRAAGCCVLLVFGPREGNTEKETPRQGWVWTRVIIISLQSGTARCKRYKGQRMWEGMRAFHALAGRGVACRPPSTSLGSPTPKLSQAWSWGVCAQTSFYRHGWFHPRLVLISSGQSLSPPRRCGRGRSQTFQLQIKPPPPPRPRPVLRGFPKVWEVGPLDTDSGVAERGLL